MCLLVHIHLGHNIVLHIETYWGTYLQVFAIELNWYPSIPHLTLSIIIVLFFAPVHSHLKQWTWTPLMACQIITCSILWKILPESGNKNTDLLVQLWMKKGKEEGDFTERLWSLTASEICEKDLVWTAREFRRLSEWSDLLRTNRGR